MGNNLKAGFARVDITPMMGIEIAGYFKTRLADGVLDPLEINAIALSEGGKTVLMITVDHCGIIRPIMEKYRDEVAKKTGVDKSAIYIHATHTHTAPKIIEDGGELISEYTVTVGRKLVDAAVFAIEDLKDAKMGYGFSKAPGVAFIRRYRMKDGSLKTNPGVNNPDILAPVGDIDDSVTVIRFKRDNAPDITLINFANHPDTVGGNKISGDWPAFTRRVFEQAVSDTKCILFNGAQGDVNHVNVAPKGGFLNDMFDDFDGCSRGYGHARYIGRVIAGAAMQIYDKVEYVEKCNLRYLTKEVLIPSNKPSPEDMPLARKYHELHMAGRDDEIPYKAMMLTTVVAEAGRMVRLENAPDAFPMLFSAVAIGDVAFFGIPGEPFSGIGRAVKANVGWKAIVPTCNTNAKEGYFPTNDAYDEGGYEARSSNYKSGVADRIAEVATEMLGELLNS